MAARRSEFIMFNKIKLLVFIICCTFVASSGVISSEIALSEPTTEITVSAAVSLKSAFLELGRIYESQNPVSRVMFNFGASGDLAAQIKGGAPVDVFASAAVRDMDDIDNGGYVVNETRTDFAANSVVLIAPISSKIEIASFEDLKRAEIRNIAVGNPRTVPAGRYSDETFRYYKIDDKIRDKLVFAENVRQVLDYVVRDEVDAGVVYMTDAKATQQGIKIIMIAPEASHNPIIYPIAVVRGTKHEKNAKAFISLVISEAGRKILSRYGFKQIVQAK
jgi:molybdate transport system substrate-binding protein